MPLQSTWIMNKLFLFLPVALESLEILNLSLKSPAFQSFHGYPTSAPSLFCSALPGSLSLWKSLQTLGKAPRISDGAWEGLSGVQEVVRNWTPWKCLFVAQISALADPQKMTSMHIVIILFSEHGSFPELLKFLCSCCQAFLWILNCELFGLCVWQCLSVEQHPTHTQCLHSSFVCINVTNRTQVAPQENQSRFGWWLLNAFSSCSLQLFRFFDSQIWVFFFSSS